MTQLELPFTEEERRWFGDPIESQVHSPVKGDLKDSLYGKKPQLSQIPPGALTWSARAFQYGASKYERGNYLRPTVDRHADLDRLSAYLDATLRHIFAVTREIEWSRGVIEPHARDRFIGATTDDESKLPHLAHALTSLMMCIQQGIDADILPEDPGTPWESK